MPSHHPRGIEPFGNSFLQPDVPLIRDASLGNLHVLGDDLVLQVIGQLDARDLANASLASKALYCFAGFEDCWKALVLEEFEGRFVWSGTWKETYVATAAAAKGGTKQPTASSTPGGSEAAEPDKKRRKKQHGSAKSAGRGGTGGAGRGKQLVKVKGFYSDLLYQPWFCATTELQPEWLEVDNIDRRSGLTVEQFIAEYEVPNRPVVITDVVSKWPARKKWSLESLRKAFAGHDVIAGNYEMSFDTYLEYCRDQTEEQPLYLFDKKFCKRAPQLAKDFSVPPYFQDDLFSVLGEDKRPDYRWLIIGPSRSGSSFHVDPNSTSAWNAVITGKKKWVMYPPHVTPPGVHPSPDGADVAAPVSLVEWFFNFYSDAMQEKVKPVECIVNAGEMIFVPRGWWHMAINLETSIAITQNFVSRTTLPHVLAFLQPGRSDLVSGCSKEERTNLHQRFVEALEQQKPEVMQALEADRQAKQRKAEEQAKLSKLFKETKASSGNAEVQAAAPAASGFSFGFNL